MHWPFIVHTFPLAAVLVLLAGCGTPTPAPAPPSISLEVTPTALTVPAGQQATVRITLHRSGTHGTVTLNVSDVPAPLNVTLATTTPQDATDAVVAVKPGTAPGRYSWPLRATTAGASTEVLIPVTVPAAPDVAPPSVALHADVAAVTSPSTVTLTADATDDVGVASVTLYRGGLEIAARSAAPWTFPVNLTKADNGQPQFVARAIDTSGNITWSGSVVLNVHIDVSAPTLSLTSATESSSATYRLTGLVDTQSGLRSLTVAVNSAPAQDLPNPTGQTFSTDLTLREGLNTVVATVTDVMGLVGSATWAITYTPPDTTPPRIQLRAEKSGTLMTSAPVTLTADATDDRGVRDVTFVLDGMTYNPLATDRDAPYTATFLPFSTSNGLHTVTATATDTNGLTSTAQMTLNVDIERVGPNITITSPGIIEDGTHHVLTGTVTDPSNVVRMQLRPAAGGGDIPGLTLQNGTFSVPLPVPVGYWRYVLTAEDGMGNISSLDIAVNNRGPDVTAPTQTPVWVPELTVSYANAFAVVTRAQDDRNLAWVELLVDGRATSIRNIPPHVPSCTPPVNGLQGCSSPDPYTPPTVKTIFTTAFTAAQNGLHTIQIRATDTAGNVSTGPILTLTVAIDATHPLRPPSAAIGGRIFDWPVGSPGVSSIQATMADPAGDTSHSLGEMGVTPDDGFSFTLPTASSMTQLLGKVVSTTPDGCTVNISISDPLARSSAILIFRPMNGRSDTGVELHGLSPAGLPRRAIYLFSDRAWTYHGIIRCVSTSGFVDVSRYDLAFSAGWTLVAMDTVPTTNPQLSSEVHYSNTSLDGLYWEYH